MVKKKPSSVVSKLKSRIGSRSGSIKKPSSSIKSGSTNKSYTSSNISPKKLFGNQFSSFDSVAEFNNSEPSEIEVDIDERVMRYSSRLLSVNEKPNSLSVDNSRILKVLEEEFPTEIDHQIKLKAFDSMNPPQSISYLGGLIGCVNHDENLVSFWILDILTEVLLQGQMSEVTNENLKVICSWFGHILKILSVYGYSYEDFFKYINQLLVESEEAYFESSLIPTPQEVNAKINLKIEKEAAKAKQKESLKILENNGDRNLYIDRHTEATDTRLEHKLTAYDEDEQNYKITTEEYGAIEEEKSEDCTKLYDLKFLTEQIHIIFGNRFKYEVIKSVLASPPEIEPIVIVDDMKFPKKIGLSQHHIEEMSKRDHDMARSKSVLLKTTKASKKSKGEPAEPKKDAVKRFQMEMEELDRQRSVQAFIESTRDKFIKPLIDATDDKFFENIFPRRESTIVPRDSIKKAPKKKK